MHPIQQRKSLSGEASLARRVRDREVALRVARVRVAPADQVAVLGPVALAERPVLAAVSVTPAVAPAALEVAEALGVVAVVEEIVGQARQARARAVALVVGGLEA